MSPCWLHGEEVAVNVRPSREAAANRNRLAVDSVAQIVKISKERRSGGSHGLSPHVAIDALGAERGAAESVAMPAAVVRHFCTGFSGSCRRERRRRKLCKNGLQLGGVARLAAGGMS